ncbi:MAG: hypothetical protein LUH55_05250, partial [Bacteroides thetaiotaomicron]|nr:hypothetical protein [Bacteroides thetaiotaomicron]
MKLLLIMPRFFDYPEIIKGELETIGYDVDFFDDRPSTNGFVKAIIRINRNILHRYIRRYFNYMMKTVRSQTYDVIFLISGQSLSFGENMIAELKDAQPSARFLLYQWDSLNNFPHIQKLHKYFEKCYSFDREDCKAISRLMFLPLFYSRRYEEIGKDEACSMKYDFCFVGTAHPKKYKFIKQMSAQLKKVYPK